MTKDYTKVIFNGGVSTEPEVNELLDKIGVPTPGQQIAYSRIEEIAGCKRGESRWQSVTVAWRKKLERDHNILLLAVPNEGFQAMTPKERVNYGGKKFELGIRDVERAVLVIQRTDRGGLSDDDKKAADFIQNTGAALSASKRLAARTLQFPELDKGNGNGVGN